MVKATEGCTGSYIAPGWILTAAHCVDNYKNMGKNLANGDVDIVFEDDDQIFVTKNNKNPEPKNLQWTESPAHTSTRRKVDRIIMHKQFEGEALSWKGFDLALIHTNDNGSSFKVNPVCLAGENFPDLDATKPWPMFMAGHGRRLLSHCFTNEVGPETFETCGRPVACSHNHRARKCGLEFLYKGELRKNCLTEETPSAGDPDCVKLRKAVPELKESQKLIHIFNGDEYVTTCYPVKPAEGSRGWCTTRKQGIDTNSEPTYRSGWGFCSNATNQKSCNEEIDHSEDTKDMSTSILEDKYCVDKLEANLLVEQPKTKRESYDPLLEKSNVFCVGRNYTRNFKEDLFYKVDGTKNVVTNPTQEMIRQLSTKGKINPHPIDGGPSCFGDSGGPFWRMVPHKEKGHIPVLVGVYSFMLWGTCIGQNEPGYYGRVKHYINWILEYVPKDQVCIYSDKFVDRKV